MTLQVVMCTVLLLLTLNQVSQSHPLSVFDNEKGVEDISTEAFLRQLTNSNDDDGGGGGGVLLSSSALVYTPLENEDLVLAETHLFRPLFVYRQKIAKRINVKKVSEDDQ